MKNRQEGGYKGFDPRSLPTDAYERIYQVHKPLEDNLEYTSFDLRAPHNSHMSTVAYLERTFHFVYETQTNGHFTPATTNNVLAMIASPGFTLQNVMKNITMDFGYTTVTDKPHEWVPFYTHLYPKSLKNYVKHSGRSFHDDRNSAYTATTTVRVQSDNEILRLLRLDHIVETLPDEHRAVLDYYQPIVGEQPNLFAFDLREDHAVPTVNYFVILSKYTTTSFDTNDGAPAIGHYVTDWRRLGVGANQPVYKSVDKIGARVLESILHDLSSHTFFSLTELAGDFAEASETREEIEAIDEGLRTQEQKNQLEAADHAYHALLPMINKIRALADVTAELFRKYNDPTHYSNLVGDSADVFDGYMLLPRTMKVYLEHLQSHPQMHTLALGGHGAQLRRFTHDYGDGTINFVNLPAQNTLGFYMSDVDSIINMDNFGPHHNTSQTPAILAYYQNKAEADAGLAQNTADLADVNITAAAFRTISNTYISQGFYPRTLTQIFTAMGYGTDARTAQQRILAQKYTGTADVVPFWLNYFNKYIKPLHAKRALIEDKAVKGADGSVVVPEDGVFLHVAINAHFKLRFIEPLIVGVHKPGEHCNIGCWRDTGDIIPRIDRYKYDIHWLDNLGFRLVLATTIAPLGVSPRRITCKGVSDTKLHTTHYRGLMKPHTDLYLHDFKLHTLHSFTMNDQEEHIFDFNLHHRSIPPPLYICFFTKLHVPDVTQPIRRYNKIYHQGPGISKLLLHSNTRLKVFDYMDGENQARLNLLTQNLYPEYDADKDGFGAACVIPYAAIPKSVHQEHFTDDITGRIGVKNTIDLFANPVNTSYRCDICALLIYKDKYLSLLENDARRVLDL